MRVVVFYTIQSLIRLHRKCIDESRAIVLAVAACEPCSKQFFDVDVLKPLADECNVDQSILEPQLSVAKNVIKGRNNVETLEDVYELIASMSSAFPQLCSLLRAALTIPVSSASAERSFSSLKRIKTYLRSKMDQHRLSNLSLISIERDLSKTVDYDKVLDKFASISRRIALH